jgi:nitrite reductase (NADH) small subunit/3-phenylpropionate/trans-cinnamate dioxygenase ferredoxin subunit
VSVSASDRAWVRLIPAAKCRMGAGTFVEHAGRELGVFVMTPERVYVLDNACPHAGGNLSAGEVADGIVTCPWHQWQFRISSGVCVDSAAARTRRYAARVVDGWVEVALASDDDNSASP